MATVYVGGASIDENGKAHGGKAGNQSGRELRKQPWYKHSKGWRVFRAKSAAAENAIAQDMEYAIANRHIGYNQYQRNTLYNAAKPFDFDCAKVTADVECDCSALVRVCCAYAGIMGLPADFRTGNMPANLMATGRFVEMTGAKYTDQSAYLRRGDILVTKTSGHTVVVLNNGSKAEPAPDADAAPVPEGLHYGDVGSAVEAMQRALLLWDDKCLPRYGADGDFGSETEKAVKAFQTAKGLPASGVYDQATRAALAEAVKSPKKPESGCDGDSCPVELPHTQILITGGSVNVRSAPGTEGTRVLGVVHKGDALPYQGEAREWGGRDWYLVEYNGGNGWVSSKYSEVTAR